MSTVMSQKMDELPSRQEDDAQPLNAIRQLVMTPWQDLSGKGLKGMLDTVVRLMGVGLTYPEHRALVNEISRPATRAIFKVFPRVAFRYTLPYLSLNIPRERRLGMLKGHYQFVNDRFRPEFFATTLSRSLCLWSHRVNNSMVSIWASGPCIVTRHREGDIALTMEVDGQTVCKTAFSIVPAATFMSRPAWAANTSHVLYVGQMQGGPDCFELIKELTKSFHDISPMDLLMSAMAGFSDALGAQYLVGVSQGNNISYNDDTFSVSKGYFNYTDFWARYNGQRNSEGDFWIRVPFDEKPIQQISSNHRKRTLQKRAFKREVFDHVGQVIQSLMLR